MASDRAWRYLQSMHYHHIALSVALSVAIWVSLFASTVGAYIAIFAGVRSAKHPQARRFDFAASARRIRTMPIPARNDG